MLNKFEFQAVKIAEGGYLDSFLKSIGGFITVDLPCNKHPLSLNWNRHLDKNKLVVTDSNFKTIIDYFLRAITYFLQIGISENE